MDIKWRKSSIYILGDTGLELQPEFGSGWYFVVYRTGNTERLLTDAMPLKQAKSRAEYHAKKLEKYKEKVDDNK